MLEEGSASITIPDVGPEDWVKVNPGTVGFYRTSYPPELLHQLIPAIQDRSLPPLDRLGLIDDLFALVYFMIIFIFWVLVGGFILKGLLICQLH
jgi:puromycin-sensitive aminopeptidase